MLDIESVPVLKAVKTVFRARPASRIGSREPSPSGLGLSASILALI
jgi:hypothetical protein